MRIRGFIFDMDGTIVDSKLNFDSIRHSIGIPNKEPILEYIENSSDQSFIDRALEIVHDHEIKGARQSQIIRDFKDFYLHLKSINIPIALLTRNSKAVTQYTLDKHKLNFDIVLTRDCCKPKPDPEGLEIIHQKWNIPKENLLYIGDYFFDLETAKNANVRSALILNKSNTHFKDIADLNFSLFKELKELI
jgi:HAD superfamily hydrolase (TIGR01549 family)